MVVSREKKRVSLIDYPTRARDAHSGQSARPSPSYLVFSSLSRSLVSFFFRLATQASLTCYLHCSYIYTSLSLPVIYSSSLPGQSSHLTISRDCRCCCCLHEMANAHQRSSSSSSSTSCRISRCHLPLSGSSRERLTPWVARFI